MPEERQAQWSTPPAKRKRSPPGPIGNERQVEREGNPEKWGRFVSDSTVSGLVVEICQHSSRNYEKTWGSRDSVQEVDVDDER
jgi:hypothetical protein